ncbi:MAG: hypothetical protein KGI79_02670 [Patescibacteria group bacterium]|nr:hypothetical protein [Patescibacteria group bacterium]MDE2116753.1 hypothetical protein [Patescibacteria group bacterium]
MRHAEQNKVRNQRAFAMLFAVLTASVLLSIGLSIFDLTVKELSLTASGRESQFAFYAADTGAECALYWDFKGTDIFATSSDSRSPSPSNPDCVDTQGQALQTINITPSMQTSDSAVTVFSLNIPSVSPQFCAIVTVTKDSSSGITKTTIDSRGHNEPCSDSVDPNLVERALKVTY